jgi:hypothetical protein
LELKSLILLPEGPAGIKVAVAEGPENNIKVKKNIRYSNNANYEKVQNIIRSLNK